MSSFTSTRILSVLLLTVLLAPTPVVHATINGGCDESELNSVTTCSAMDVPAENDIGNYFTLQKAIDSCNSTGDKIDEYSSLYKQIVSKRNLRWKKLREDGGEINFIQMINDKLGGYLYATKMGVRTPRILFCGIVKGLPRDIQLGFGDRYVVKILKGYNAQGVKVVIDGVNILKDEKVTYDTLASEYELDDAIIVEEFVESANIKYDGLVPPDYKFHVFGGRPEIMWFVDRNRNAKCKNYYDLSSAQEWRFMEGFLDTKLPNCSPSGDEHGHYLEPSRRIALANAVQVLADNIPGNNWVRIDMYDSKDGPILGEFTPFSSNGKTTPLDGCVMSYLFIAYSEQYGGWTDDAATASRLKDKVGDFRNELGIDRVISISAAEKTLYHQSNMGFFSPEAHEWYQSNILRKCQKVMAAQYEFHHKEEE